MKLAVVMILLVSGSAVAETWDWDNDPMKFDENYEYRLSALPMKGDLPVNKMPWASSYWPRMKGSINYRWNTPSPTGFNLRSPNRTQVQSMTVSQLAELSPAEKFDLVQGHYDYPLSSQVGYNATPRAKDYEGICDGWTATAIAFTEPAPVEIKNPDGIVIPFGSSDVKALMSYDVSINYETGALGAVFIGDYCSGGRNCRDINPGSFHVILANEIGLKKQSFAVDVDAGPETWNQPVHGYEFEILEETSVRGAARAYVVHAKFKYAQDDLTGKDASVMRVFSWLPTIGTPQYATETMELDYVLEVDYDGKIIGGSWLGNSRKTHPDIFWKASKKIEWTPEFQILNTIYKPAF
jgi:Transglutaminase elicitor